MDWINFFFGAREATYGDIRALGKAQAQSAERIRSQIRRMADSQTESVESLAQENRELRLYLTAIMQLLLEKELLRPEEVQAKVLSLLPPTPAPSPADDNPFAGLDR